MKIGSETGTKMNPKGWRIQLCKWLSLLQGRSRAGSVGLYNTPIASRRKCPYSFIQMTEIRYSSFFHFTFLSFSVL